MVSVILHVIHTKLWTSYIVASCIAETVAWLEILANLEVTTEFLRVMYSQNTSALHIIIICPSLR